MSARRYNPGRIPARPVYDIAGEKFHASKGEYERWCHLQLLEKAGEISDLEHQPAVELEPGIKWRLDSAYMEKGRKVWEDMKARPFTPRENLLMKLWRLHGPGLLRIITKKKGRFSVRKEVMPK